MAEHRDRAKGEQQPFRRYSPPAADRSAAQPKPVTPLSAGSPPRSMNSTAARRQQRSCRNHWRQWLQPRPGAAPSQPAPGSASPEHCPRPVSVQPSSPEAAPSSAARSPQPATPQGVPAAYPGAYRIPQPSPLVTGRVAPSLARPPASDGMGRPGSRSRAGNPEPERVPGRSPRTGAPRRSDRLTPRPGSKVTPLRRRPVWATPEAEADLPRDRPDRPAPPRRRAAPAPVLYSIRLLILGIGVAAIAGTLLSMLNPGNQISVAQPETASPATSPAADGGRLPRRRATLAALPLAQELTYVETDLVELETLTPGLTQSVFMLDLDTGNYVDVNGQSAIAAASTIKVPILVAFLQAVDAGTVSLEQGVVLREDMVAGGSGDMQFDEIGTRYTALEVATEMIINSDNTATNMIIDLLGGNTVLNQQFQDWGLRSTVLRNWLPDLEGTNTTSPADLVRVMALVERGEILSLRSRDRLLSIMQRTYTRTLIPAGIGEQNAIVYNKTGDIGTSLGDIALVDAPNGKRYLLSVFITRPHNDGRANELIRRIAARIHEEMNQPVAPVGGATPAMPAPEVEPSVAPTPSGGFGDPEEAPNVPQG
ncbi:MAG: serine hydrolase [Leptolyngbyaceae cyanobacterium T60_A2020_046]|nr:serine hydrolase [Leptolyngbyaceae cyanobacterium T60_A2020_046]